MAPWIMTFVIVPRTFMRAFQSVILADIQQHYVRGLLDIEVYFFDLIGSSENLSSKPVSREGDTILIWNKHMLPGKRLSENLQVPKWYSQHHKLHHLMTSQSPLSHAFSTEGASSTVKPVSLPVCLPDGMFLRVWLCHPHLLHLGLFCHIFPLYH